VNPLNLAVRFLLELSALFIMGWWGWRQRSDGWQIVFAVAIPLVAAAIWGTFAVPHDPSRSGSAPVPVPGIARLAIELAFFALAAWAVYDLEFVGLAALFGAIVTVHYLVSFDRIRWLMAQ
jgi:Protein of unknown function (DUF2568)